MPWLLVSCLLPSAGCSETNEPKPLTYTQLLTGQEKKVWTLTSFQVLDEGEASDVVPISQIIRNACEADDQFVFYANAERKFEYTNGPTKCSSSEPEVLLTNNWTFVNASATLEMPFPLISSGPLPFVVKSLTETSMTIELYLERVRTDEIDASYRFVLSSTAQK